MYRVRGILPNDSEAHCCLYCVSMCTLQRVECFSGLMRVAESGQNLRDSWQDIKPCTRAGSRCQEGNGKWHSQIQHNRNREQPLRHIQGSETVFAPRKSAIVISQQLKPKGADDAVTEEPIGLNDVMLYCESGGVLRERV